MLIVKRRHVIGHREHGLRPAVRGRTRAASPQGAGPDKARAPAVHSNSTVYPCRPTERQSLANGADALAACRFKDAAKAYQKCIKLQPDRPLGYFGLAMAMGRSGDVSGSATTLLQSIPLYEEGEYNWGCAILQAFDLMRRPECAAVEPPSWWFDCELKLFSYMALTVVKSNKGVAEAPSEHELALRMRWSVLDPGMACAAYWSAWECEERTVPELLEAIYRMHEYLELDVAKPPVMAITLPIRIQQLSDEIQGRGGSLTAEPSAFGSIVGDEVRLCGLVVKPELNGTCVTVVSYDESTRRYVVCKPDGRRIAMKPKNLAGGGANALASKS